MARTLSVSGHVNQKGVLLSVKNGEGTTKPFRHILSGINVKNKRAVTYKQKDGFVPYHGHKIYSLQSRGSWTVSYQGTGSPAEWSSFLPLSERKKNATQGR